MQPIPKKILENNPDYKGKTYNTLLVDGSNILELSVSADRRVNSKGQIFGGIFQFLLQIKLMLQKGSFRHVYVFWDGDNSGEYRALILPTYKSNRDKNYDLSVSGELSDYMKEVNARVKAMQNYLFNKNKDKILDRRKEKELFYQQREVVIQCLEELFVRQCVCDKVEADDLIAYYVKNKEPNERIVIMSNDRDLTQLISEDVIVYIQSQKKFINTKNHTTELGYNYQNVLLKKMICGDASDNIKGIKGVGEKTFFDNFPEVKERKVNLEEVIEKARLINDERANNKKKPLKWAENIINGVTDGVQGDRVYEINRKVIDLKTPIMTEDAKETMDGLMHAPLDPEGRSLSNLYRILVEENNIDDFKDENRFSSFFYEYKLLMESEMKNK